MKRCRDASPTRLLRLARSLGRALFLSTVALAATACAMLDAPRPDRAFVDRIEIDFTQGVPEEKPLPPVRKAGLTDEEVNTAQVYRERVRSVVNVTALSAYRTRQGGTVPSSGSGSGFIIDKRGLVVTNHHVVAGAQRVVVTMYDGSLYPARVLGTDPELDLAVLYFDPQGRELRPVPRGDSDRLQVGQKVITLGNPYGLEGTLTVGVVSALERPIETASGLIMRGMVQTDAAINPGNSGGPLLDRNGHVVGINSMILSPSGASAGLGFAIPINAAARVVAELAETGRVRRGWIDIEGVPLDPRLARAAGTAVEEGILVTRVLPDGNAAQAGLRGGADGRVIRYGRHRVPVEGDIVVAVSGEPVATIPEVLATLVDTRPGDEVAITIVRDGERQKVALTLSERPG